MNNFRWWSAGLVAGMCYGSVLTAIRDGSGYEGSIFLVVLALLAIPRPKRPKS